MVVFSAMISSLVSSSISNSYSSGEFFVELFVLILQNRQPQSLCSYIYRQCCFFALRVQDLSHVIKVYIVYLGINIMEVKSQRELT